MRWIAIVAALAFASLSGCGDSSDGGQGTRPPADEERPPPGPGGGRMGDGSPAVPDDGG